MHRLAFAIATAVGLFAAGPDPAQARMMNPNLGTPSLTEPVACRTVRERVVRPGGRVIYRTKRVCTPGVTVGGPGCVMRRERVVRPNGSVVYRSVRRC
jgi:hypothetical protein